jgi:sugar phosphate isomerase/epimerase
MYQRSPEFGVLYDLYHSTVEGENTAAELANAGDHLSHVEIADAPGRGEPSTGTIDWSARFADLRASRYNGPSGPTIFKYRMSVRRGAKARPIACEPRLLHRRRDVRANA